MSDRAAASRLPSPGKPGRWRLRDVVDFECLLEADRREDPAALEIRDRIIGSERIRPRRPCPAPDQGDADRNQVFWLWLEARRHTRSDGGPTPGELFETARGLLLTLLTVLGLVSGGLAAIHLLRYDGVQPVNVAAYLGALVFLQIGLVLLSVVLLMWRRCVKRTTSWSPLISILRWAWVSLAARWQRHFWIRLPAEQRAQAKAAWGSAASFGTLYRPVYLWPLLGFLQWFGVCFNLAALAATLALVLFSDRAFGWQSAMPISPEQVRQAAELLALPWSWLSASDAVIPSLSQIEGSRIILKDGIRQLATENLVAWWPFLCWSVAVYGLLPRALLGLAAWWSTRQALARLSFQHVACDRLYERLLAHELDTTGQGDQPERAPTAYPTSEQTPAFREGGSAEPLAAREALLLIEPELWDSGDPETMRGIIRDRLQWNVARSAAAPLNPTDLKQSMDQWPSWKWTDDQPRIAVLLEAWKPPIAESLEALRLLRRHFGPRAKICLALVGRPRGGQTLTPVTDMDATIWERQIGALGDPMLRVERAVAHA